MTHKVLLLAAESGEGQYNRLIDPRLKDKLAQDNIITRERFISALTRDDLNYFDTVVLMRTPVPGHAKNDMPDFEKVMPWLVDFAHDGGRLMLMFSECYGKSVASLNKLGEAFNIRFAFNVISEDDQGKRSALPNMPDGRLITCILEESGEDIDLVFEGGHGIQNLTCLPENNWRILIKGAETCTSKSFPAGLYAGSVDVEINAPVFACERDFGQGQVIAFPASSALWIANCYLPRWQGYLMEQHNQLGYRFIKKLFIHKKSGGIEKLDEFKDIPLTGPQDFTFKAVSEDQQRKIAGYNSYKLYLGSLPEGVDVETAIAVAHKNDYRLMVIIHDYDKLTKASWNELRKRYNELGKRFDMLVVPGLEQLDDEGNYCVVFNVDELPELRTSYPNSNMLEDLLVKLNGYTSVFARSCENRIPVWHHGGYNQLEIGDTDDIAVYRDRVSSGAFLAGMHIARNTMPGEENMQNWLLGDKLENVMNAIRENRHLNYISTGPLIKTFMFEGPDLIDDDWEGFWYGWEKDEEIQVRISLYSDSPICEINLYDGEEVLKSFKPASLSFDTKVTIRMEKDLRLHLTAHDEAGGELVASYPLYTRNRLYWCHMGSDQMNDYHNVFIPDDDGSLGVKDKFYEPCGFVTCGFAWGDYIRITPPVPWKDIMPQGIEVSSLVGNFKSFHPSPFLKLKDGYDFLNNHYRKLGKATQDEHILYSVAKGCWLEQPGAVWTGHGKRKFTPTRNFTDSDLWHCRAKYRIPEWKAYGRSMVIVEVEIEWLQDFEFSNEMMFSFGHSFHELKEGLKLKNDENEISVTDFIDMACEDDYEGEKEWDNQGMVKLLVNQGDAQSRIEIQTGESLFSAGDNMGNYSFDNLDIPGKVFVRGWKRLDGQFVLSYDLMPQRKKFSAGDKLVLKYSISVYGK